MVRSFLSKVHVLHLEAVDFVEADVVVVEATLLIAVDLLGEFHERAHPFLQVIRLMEVHEVESVGEGLLLPFHPNIVRRPSHSSLPPRL